MLFFRGGVRDIVATSISHQISLRCVFLRPNMFSLNLLLNTICSDGSQWDRNRPWYPSADNGLCCNGSPLLCKHNAVSAVPLWQAESDLPLKAPPPRPHSQMPSRATSSGWMIDDADQERSQRVKYRFQRALRRWQDLMHDVQILRHIFVISCLYFLLYRQNKMFKLYCGFILAAMTL